MECVGALAWHGRYIRRVQRVRHNRAIRRGRCTRAVRRDRNTRPAIPGAEAPGYCPLPLRGGPEVPGELEILSERSEPPRRGKVS